ncbi:MAG: hypothetical protein K6D37_08900 [Prevotella sp.]|nr:hypothetical protein [Prevotella sp.]
MKKLFFALMAVAAITLTSCLGKTATPGLSDPQAEAPDDAAQLAAALESQLKADNGEGFFALVGNIQEKAIGFIKDNPQKAKEYLSTAQKFLKDNAAQISTMLGKITNSDVAERAQELIKSVSEQPAEQLLGLVGAMGSSAQEAVEGQVEEVKDAIGEKLDEVTDKVQKATETVGEKANQVKDVVDKANEVKNAVGTVLGK